ncbi:MAG: lytic transglycosylase domain-containing protein [Thiotrichaceae bacterium]|nr:lytic transglycosylase domain-containing protein [Thiotrichaceae bacterium]
MTNLSPFRTIFWLLLCSSPHTLWANEAPHTTIIYKYVDENGILHLSNKSPEEQDQLLYSRSYLVPSEVSSSVSSIMLPIPKGLNLKRFAPPSPPTKNTAALSTRKQNYQMTVQQVAQRWGIDAALLDAVITVESGYNPQALSPKGAQGLMQLMPDTAARYGVTDRSDPLANLEGGARYLRDLLLMFKGDVTLALAGYNAGENAVIKAGNRIPAYAETQEYVVKVLEKYRNSVR